MKKYILSSLLVATFGTYAIYVRTNPVINPIINTTNSAPKETLNPGSSVGNNSSSGTSISTPVPSKVPTKTPTKTITRYRSDDGEGGDDGYYYQTTVSTPAPVTTTVTPTPVVAKPTPTPTPVTNTGLYKDGIYTGDSLYVVDDYMQVAVTISGGKITDVTFPVWPQNSGQSRRINNYAMPILKQEAIQAQNANVDTVSGATYSSQVFSQSLGSALAQAKN